MFIIFFAEMIPYEIWQKIFSFLDLKHQSIISQVNLQFHNLIISLWRSKLLKLKPSFEDLNEDHNQVRMNLTMKTVLDDESENLEKCSKQKLYKILLQYKILQQLCHYQESKDINSNTEVIIDRNILILDEKYPFQYSLFIPQAYL